jgi:hypothetical protein
VVTRRGGPRRPSSRARSPLPSGASTAARSATSNSTTNTGPRGPCYGARAAGQIVQIEGTSRVTYPLPFGLDVAGDGALPVGQ